MSREVEQDKPTPNRMNYSQDTLAIRFNKALIESKKTGVQTYGTALQPFNGRDSFRDAFEELVDLAVYMENLRRERKEVNEILVECLALALLKDHPELATRISEALEGMGETTWAAE